MAGKLMQKAVLLAENLELKVDDKTLMGYVRAALILNEDHEVQAVRRRRRARRDDGWWPG